jgi:hypothetical protein
MPLELFIWHEIHKRVARGAPRRGAVSKDAFLRRLRKVAKTLPKAYLKKTIIRRQGHGMRPRTTQFGRRAEGFGILYIEMLAHAVYTDENNVSTDISRQL